jgi:hypothetical protein
MRRSIAAVLVAALLSDCGSPRYYLLSPLTGIAEVDVLHMGTVGKIVERNRVAAITAFMNARRDRWYDPRGSRFATTGDLELLDSHRKRIASIAFGPGGMAQSRPSMTYVDSVARRELIVIRVGPPDETARDAEILCKLLGSKYHRMACIY